MLPLNGKPALEYTIEKLKREGFDDILIYTTRTSPNYSQLHPLMDKYKIGVHAEFKPSGTAGAIKEISNCDGEHCLKDIKEPFLVIYGDIITTEYLNKVYEFMEDSFSLLLLAHKVGFPELKYEPKDSDMIDNLGFANGSIYVINPRIINLFKDGEDIFKDTILKILPKTNTKCDVIRTSVFHCDIGAPERYEYVNRIFTEANVREI
jgi:NDP-sugar pyrophosphorylase family protein